MKLSGGIQLSVTLVMAPCLYRCLISFSMPCLHMCLPVLSCACLSCHVQEFTDFLAKPVYGEPKAEVAY